MFAFSKKNIFGRRCRQKVKLLVTSNGLLMSRNLGRVGVTWVNRLGLPLIGGHFLVKLRLHA